MSRCSIQYLSVGVEAVARGEVEPGVLRRLPGREPFGAVRRLADRGERFVDRSARQRVGDAELDRELGELLQLVVGPEQIDVDALHHLGDRLVGNGRKLLLQKPKKSR